MTDQLIAHAQELAASITATPTVVEHHPVIEALSGFALMSSAVIGYIGIAIMMYGCALAAADFVRNQFVKRKHLSHLRIQLGKHLALGLEFLVGKDIIESIVEPTWDDLAKLGAIIVIRTVITVLLTKELKEVEEEIKVEREEVEVEREEMANAKIQEMNKRQ